MGNRLHETGLCDTVDLIPDCLGARPECPVRHFTVARDSIGLGGDDNFVLVPGKP